LTLGLKVPSVLVIHDINFEHYPKDIPGHYSRYLRKYSPLFARAASQLVTVSSYSAQDIASHYGIERNKILVIPNGVNDDFRPLTSKEKDDIRQELTGGDPYFIFVGSIHPRKNLHRLLQAFDIFKNETKSRVKLLVAGNLFYMHDELRSALDQMQHRQDVIEGGRMDASRLHLAVGGALANVYVSYFEGFGIPVLEGFRCGVPVIGGNQTAIPEVAGDAAHLVNPFDIRDIADGLKKVYADEPYRETLISRGLQRASQFSWEHTSRELWRVIRSITN
jgi:glycosyltransferase involved in cell wall biosynthesis